MPVTLRRTHLTSHVCRTLSVLGAGLALLVASTAVAAGTFSEPRPIIPRADTLDAEEMFQASDRQGDSTYVWLSDKGVQLRVLRADGSLTPVRTVTTVDFAISVIRLAVGDDGRGVVVWDEWQGVDDITISLFARRVTRDGRLGPVRRVVPRTHNVSTAQVAVGPNGRAIITWSRLRIGRSSYTPWMRTFGPDSALGRVHRLGDGPNADAP